jgi:hypothetical protein
MPVKDFETFKKNCSWFIEQTDKAEIKEGCFECSDAFVETFPVLHELLSEARVADIVLTKTKKKKETVLNYKLFTWNTKNGASAGWLCKVESEDNRMIDILPEHQLLSDHSCGIQENYETDSDVEKLTDNQNFLFIKSECEFGPDKDWEEYYHELCEEENVQPIDMTNFVCFAIEANGNMTYYDLKTKKVFLFASDHCFDYVTEAEGQSEYTFYTINGADTFVDYVEMLARQWLNEIK